MEANKQIKDVAIRHIKRDAKELSILRRAFDGVQQQCLEEAIANLKKLLSIEGINIDNE